MCGRYSLTATSEALSQHFQLKKGMVMVPRYNVAPTQIAPIVKTRGQIDFLQWGLVPTWMAEKTENGFINARSETVSQKPSFRSAFKMRRCLVIASGYYEWKLIGKTKQPYYIHPKDGLPFAFAGLWEDETFTILTKAADQNLLEIHQRMPIILPPTSYQTWLNPTASLNKDIELLLLSNEATTFEFYPVTPQVNNPRFEDPQCIVSLLS